MTTRTLYKLGLLSNVMIATDPTTNPIWRTIMVLGGFWLFCELIEPEKE